MRALFVLCLFWDNGLDIWLRSSITFSVMHVHCCQNAISRAFGILVRLCVVFLSWCLCLCLCLRLCVLCGYTCSSVQEYWSFFSVPRLNHCADYEGPQVGRRMNLQEMRVCLVFTALCDPVLCVVLVDGYHLLNVAYILLFSVVSLWLLLVFLFAWCTCVHFTVDIFYRWLSGQVWCCTVCIAFVWFDVKIWLDWQACTIGLISRSSAGMLA